MPSASETNPILNENILASNIISKSLLFSLGRQYLDFPDKLKDFKILNYDGYPTGPIYWLKLEQVGFSLNSFFQPFTALQTALTACHNYNKYNLVFVIYSDGMHNHIYLGIATRDEIDHSSKNFVSGISKFLQGNWPGTKLRCLDNNAEEVKNQIIQPIEKFRFAQAITGIPSLKPGDNPGYPQSLDRLLRGMRGLPFTYMVIAEPMSEEEVDDIINKLRELMSLIHSFSKINFNETLTEGTSFTEGRTDNISESNSQRKINTSDIINVISNLVFPFIPNSPIGLMMSLCADSVSNLTYQQNTITKTEGVGISSSRGINSSSAKAFGKEYINAHAQAIEAQIKQYLQRFEQSRASGCWNVGAYLLTKESDVIEQANTQLRALLSGESSIFEPIRIHNLPVLIKKSLKSFERPNFSLVDKESKKLNHPLGNNFNGLTTPLNTKELALMVNFPWNEVPGIKAMTSANFSLNPPTVNGESILLGNLLEGGEPNTLQYKISPASLAKHCLVTGITGSGKSTTNQKILTELLEKNIPFLVIEPAKNEYVKWAIEYNKTLPEDSDKKIAIYMPGMRDIWRGYKLEKLILNPFDFVWLSENTRPNILGHIDRLKSILNASLPMMEILPILVENILFRTYTVPHNWLEDQLPSFGTNKPTLTQFLDQIRPVIKGKGYETKITDNLIAALTTRIQSLRLGWKKQLFDSQTSTPWRDIFDRPVIINISNLGDDADKSFMMAIVLLFLYEYRQVQDELLSLNDQQSSGLRHLAVIEEAHRILLKTQGGILEQANPQGKVAEMFANMLSEIRAYGQGLLIADQVPSRLVADAIKNTNLKIVHRLVASDDRDAMASCLTLSSEQSRIINHLRPGQAIICGEQDDMASWVEIVK